MSPVFTMSAHGAGLQATISVEYAPTRKAAQRAAFRESNIEKKGNQRIAEGCSIIRPRPNGFLDNLAISLDMDHLLSVVCPAEVCLGS